MKIHKEGYGIILTALSIILVILAVIFLTLGCAKCFAVCAIIGLFKFLFIMWFFRCPKRDNVKGDNLVVSSCDGKVIIIKEVEENEYLKCKCIQVSIFMSVVNVHVNYHPVNGKILYAKHHQGKYIIASYPKASEKNERTSIVVETNTKNKHKILFRQIAGYVARRIVCYAKVGDTAEQCSQVGFIKFGSRMDLFLPLDTVIKVKEGDKVKACESIIAELS